MSLEDEGEERDDRATASRKSSDETKRGSAPGEGGAEGVNNGRKRGANEDDEPPRDTERKKDEERQKN